MFWESWPSLNLAEAEGFMRDISGLDRWGNASHFDKLKLWTFRHKQLNLLLKHMLSANREESMILSAEHWPSQHQDWAQAKSLVCNYRYLNYVFSLSLAFCIENHCYRKTKSSSLLPVCSLCVSLHSVIISSGGAVQRFARHFTIMSLNRERSLMLC